MVYVPFPNSELDGHTQLAAWRAATGIKEWKNLKQYLADHSKKFASTTVPSKCWYSELPLGDNYSIDVEHFRPKASGDPLPAKDLRDIKREYGVEVHQTSDSGQYPWLEFEYRNYRLVTAMTNRAGAKHTYFPILKGTTRLATGQYPWSIKEYNLMLDPANKHDSSLLTVYPNGLIAPSAPKGQLTNTMIASPSSSWISSEMNFMRAAITIYRYNLNDTVFVDGRRGKIEEVTNDINMLLKALVDPSFDAFKQDYVRRLRNAILPSAPFSLAARCAFRDFKFPDGTNDALQSQLRRLLDGMLKINVDAVDSVTVDWSRS